MSNNEAWNRIVNKLLKHSFNDNGSNVNNSYILTKKDMEVINKIKSGADLTENERLSAEYLSMNLEQGEEIHRENSTGLFKDEFDNPE